MNDDKFYQYTRRAIFIACTVSYFAGIVIGALALFQILKATGHYK